MTKRGKKRPSAFDLPSPVHSCKALRRTGAVTSRSLTCLQGKEEGRSLGSGGGPVAHQLASGHFAPFGILTGMVRVDCRPFERTADAVRFTVDR